MSSVDSLAKANSEKNAEFEESRAVNFGFQRVERLRGNVGYIALSVFARPEWAAATAQSAMQFVSNTDALIIDLRDQDGGRPEMVALLASYLVEKPTQLTGIFWRRTGKIAESWTLPYVPGPRYLSKRVYILTSHSGTVSAAEAFAYDLKTIGRATLVGETTAGAANPGGFKRLTSRFKLFVPTGRAVNPVTGTNWEEVGVAPDVPTSADSALKTGYLAALRSLAAETNDESRRNALRKIIDSREKDPR